MRQNKCSDGTSTLSWSTLQDLGGTIPNTKESSRDLQFKSFAVIFDDMDVALNCTFVISDVGSPASWAKHNAFSMISKSDKSDAVTHSFFIQALL